MNPALPILLVSVWLPLAAFAQTGNNSHPNSVLDSFDKYYEARRKQPESNARIALMQAEQRKLEAETARLRQEASKSISGDQTSCIIGEDVRIPSPDEIQTALQRMADRYPDVEKYLKSMIALGKGFLPTKQLSYFEYLQGMYFLAKYSELSTAPSTERGSLVEPASPSK